MYTPESCVGDDGSSRALPAVHNTSHLHGSLKPLSDLLCPCINLLATGNLYDRTSEQALMLVLSTIPSGVSSFVKTIERLLKALVNTIMLSSTTITEAGVTVPFKSAGFQAKLDFLIPLYRISGYHSLVHLPNL